MPHSGGLTCGLDALRLAVARALCAAQPAYAGDGMLLMEGGSATESPPGSGPDDGDLAASSEESEGDRQRLIGLVELARKGDTDAFGLLYDHYNGSVYRFLYYRTRSQA